MIRGHLVRDRQLRRPLVDQNDPGQVQVDDPADDVEQSGDDVLEPPWRRPAPVTSPARQVWNNVRSSTSQVRSITSSSLELHQIRTQPVPPVAGRSPARREGRDRAGQLTGLEVLGEIAVRAGLAAPVPVTGRSS